MKNWTSYGIEFSTTGGVLTGGVLTHGEKKYVFAHSATGRFMWSKDAKQVPQKVKQQVRRCAGYPKRRAIP
jgi:hypothetical protein